MSNPPLAHMPLRSERLTGILLTLLSSVLFGLTGIFTKLIFADAWTIAGWRGLVGGMLVAAYVIARRRPGGSALSPVALRLGAKGWLLVAISASAGTVYIASFKYTFVANVAIIYAAIPFAAAVFDRMISGEPFGRRTMRNAAISVAGVGVMVAGGLASGHLFGDVLAFIMMVLCALYLALVRAFRDVDVVWATAISALILFPAAFLLSDPFAISVRDLALTAAFGVVLALAMVTWTEGARRIPAAEAGLLGSGEIPVAIGFAWLLLSETPPPATMLGGAIVLGAVFAQTAHGLPSRRKRTAA